MRKKGATLSRCWKLAAILQREGGTNSGRVKKTGKVGGGTVETTPGSTARERGTLMKKAEEFTGISRRAGGNRLIRFIHDY